MSKELNSEQKSILDKLSPQGEAALLVELEALNQEWLDKIVHRLAEARKHVSPEDFALYTDYLIEEFTNLKGKILNLKEIRD